VRQIILNLLSNAIKFTETGSITLHAEADSEWVAISVIDTGIGIPEAARPTIFQRFGQVSPHTDASREMEGTGLGLEISKHLSQLHGGDLTFESVEGKGSRFTFTLPIATPDQIESMNPQQASGNAFTIFEPSAFDSDEIYSILLVEDEVSMRELLRRAFESAGYIVTDTHDGAHVMELALGLLPSVILLDVNLPHVSGWTLLHALRADPATASIPVIVCTASPEWERALQLGAAAFISKPATPERILSVIRETLHIPETLLSPFEGHSEPEVEDN
jgi:CheY-like chemotaxis protein